MEMQQPDQVPVVLLTPAARNQRHAPPLGYRRLAPRSQHKPHRGADGTGCSQINRRPDHTTHQRHSCISGGHISTTRPQPTSIRGCDLDSVLASCTRPPTRPQPTTIPCAKIYHSHQPGEHQTPRFLLRPYWRLRRAALLALSHHLHKLLSEQHRVGGTVLVTFAATPPSSRPEAAPRHPHHKTAPGAPSARQHGAPDTTCPSTGGNAPSCVARVASSRPAPPPRHAH